MVKRIIRAHGFEQMILKHTGAKRLEDLPELLLALMTTRKEVLGKDSK